MINLWYHYLDSYPILRYHSPCFARKPQPSVGILLTSQPSLLLRDLRGPSFLCDLCVTAFLFAPFPRRRANEARS